MISDWELDFFVVGLHLAIYADSIMADDLVGIHILFIIDFLEGLLLFGVQNFSIVQFQHCDFLKQECLLLFQLSYSF